MDTKPSLRHLGSARVWPVASSEVRSYSELQRQIHYDLRAQHPEWIEPNGNSPICDFYERRLAELIDCFQSRERNLVAA